MEPTTYRGKILAEACGLTEGDRNRAYGSPRPNLQCFMDLATAYLRGKQTADRWEYDATDGAILMVLAKVSRVAANPKHRDNYTDMAAYAAIAGECALHHETQDEKVKEVEM